MSRISPSGRESMRASEVIVVMPTFNEVGNIEAMARGVSSHGYRLLIVDDNSPDGTGELADTIAADNPLVAVLHRSVKQGLGPAYSAGYEKAGAMGARITCGMDADFSHNPADLPRLVAAITNGADVVIGSRYVDGGGVSNWSLTRRMLSRGGNLYARTLLGLDTHDATAGFRAYKTESLMALDPRTCEASGYGFLVEMTDRATRAEYKIVEVPIVFSERTVGDSKMSLAIAFETLRLVTGWGVRRFFQRLRSLAIRQ